MTTDFGDLESRPGRAFAAEPVIEGNRWWPSEPERLVDLYQAGAVMSSAERAEAERELEARARRSATPPVLRREDVVFEPSSIKGLDVGTIIGRHRGIEVRTVGLDVHRIPPGAHTEARVWNEAVYHVLNGSGYSIIDGKRYDWGPHDSLHVQMGVWYQHFNTDPERPAHLLVGHPGPLLEHISPYAQVFKGDSFSDHPDDFKPEHPFTKERVSVGHVAGEKWMSNVQLSMHERREARQAAKSAARVLLKASEAIIERSLHRGDWLVALVDRHMGFDNRILAMYVHQMPPASHTETHKHGEAVVYVLSGRGYSIVDGQRFDWQAGDCIFVQPGQWHQHFNTDPELVSQHVALFTQPLWENLHENAEVSKFQVEEDYQPLKLTREAGSWWA
ncbi:MAG: cupin domain-containing protein [Myxococcales bacterium]|nr:cupin domain-containing protein [Myxococcales bacterium]